MLPGVQEAFAGKNTGQIIKTVIYCTGVSHHPNLALGSSSLCSVQGLFTKDHKVSNNNIKEVIIHDYKGKKS